MALQPPTSALGSALLFPRTFFGDRGGAPPGAWRIVIAVAGVHLVGYYGFLTVAAVIVALQQPAFTALENLRDLGGWTLFQGVLTGLLVLLNWLLVSAVLHGAVRLRHGQGDFDDTVAVVGWSAPATLLALLVGGLGFLIAVARNPLVMSFDATLQAVTPVVSLAGAIGGLLTLLWLGHIWPTALHHTHEIDREHAAQATVLTLALCALVLFLGT
jgi:hypothetical protein